MTASRAQAEALRYWNVVLSLVVPMSLAATRVPRDHHNWCFEVKYDGFRTLAYKDDQGCSLVSWNGNGYRER